MKQFQPSQASLFESPDQNRTTYREDQERYAKIVRLRKQGYKVTRRGKQYHIKDRFLFEGKMMSAVEFDTFYDSVAFPMEL